MIVLPDKFSVKGNFSVEGTGKIRLPNDALDVYGGRLSGVLNYNQGRARLLGTTQA